MKTEKIKIYRNGEGMQEALNLTEKFAAYMELEGRNKFHLRLLAEEMFSMVRAITEDFSADFWLEEETGTCRLHLEAKSDLDYSKRRELLSVSTRGKNIAQRGIMEKVREIIEAGLYSMEESFSLQAQFGMAMFNYGSVGIIDTGMSDAVYSWSMQKYRDNVNSARSGDPAASEAWDELEKSIIANVADDVIVGVRKDGVELIVEKEIKS